MASLVQGRGRRSVFRPLAWLDGLWRLLRRPWLLLLTALLLLALLLSTRFIPQMPGQAQEDPASAQRWLNAEADAWGSGGTLLRALGLFAAHQSPLFYALAGLLALLSSVHLADGVLFALLPARLRALLNAPVTGEPLPVHSSDKLYRRRNALPLPPAQSEPLLAEWMAQAAGAPVTRVGLPGEEGESSAEQRLLALRRPWLAWLRPLLPLGLILATTSLWLNALLGWDVRPGTLAPGDEALFPLHGVALLYDAAPSADGLATAAITGTVAGRPVLLDADKPAMRVGGAGVRLREDVPALWVRAQAPLLSLPGDGETRASVGLLFAQEGSEQLVVLPKRNAGLRLVRLGGENEGAFLVEIFAEDAVQPVERVQVSGATTVTVPAGDEAVQVAMTPMPGLAVEVRHAPGDWLVWPALVLVLAGLAGIWLRPAFVLAQVSAWPVERSLVTLQSSAPVVLPWDEEPAGESGST